MAQSQDSINATLKTDIGYIKLSIEQINVKLDTKYVSRDEFTPVKNIVYGMNALILLAFLGVLIKKYIH